MITPSTEELLEYMHREVAKACSVPYHMLMGVDWASDTPDVTVFYKPEPVIEHIKVEIKIDG